jgi:pimeloyl-ACP methyl ester carboxylesterase
VSRRTSTDATLSTEPTAESTYREVNGVDLHVVAAGNPDDPLVVLLHGFPEFWYAWHRHIDPLVEAGYRVLVPDQRGYNLSEQPEGIYPYRGTALSRDVVELIASEGRESAHVVGHDWGAAVAWDVSLRHPEVVDRLAIANVPHPVPFFHALRSNPRQILRSLYMLYFQLPRLPEWSSRRNEFGRFVETMQGSAVRDAFTDRDMDRYRSAWREGSVTGMLNWYRAMTRHGSAPPRAEVAAPTLVMWGEQDSAILPELAEESVEYCADGRLERFPDATHWVQHEYPDRTADLLLDHLDG